MEAFYVLLQQICWYYVEAIKKHVTENMEEQRSKEKIVMREL